MDVPLLAAGCLALLGAGVHGIAGERLVIRELSVETLKPSRFGGPRMTKAMIHVTWHIVTAAFFTTGCALVLAGTALDGDAAQATGLFAAGAWTAFAVVALGVGAAYMRSPRSLLGHPGPIVIALTAALAWWGAL
jgi:hypothetical protein